MRGFAVFPRDEGDELENRRTTSETISELYFQDFIEPGDGTVSLAVPAATENLGHVEFPDAVTAQWKKTYLVRARWPRCGIYLKLWYTSPTANTANFNLTLGGRMIRRGDLLTTPYSAFSTAVTAPGPATAREILTLEYVNPNVLFAGFYELFGLRLIRSGAADANNNAFWALGMHVKITEPSA